MGGLALDEAVPSAERGCQMPEGRQLISVDRRTALWTAAAKLPLLHSSFAVVFQKLLLTPKA
jgi:hypothetical protein